MRSRLKFIFLLLLTAAITSAFTIYLLEFRKMSRIHTLEHPLMLEGSSKAGHNYLLPAGTTLYYDQAFPEGFVRYRLYINVEGAIFDTKEQSDPTRISPISAYPIGKAELAKLLNEYPLSKNELRSILSSTAISKEEVRDLLVEFSSK